MNSYRSFVCGLKQNEDLRDESSDITQLFRKLNVIIFIHIAEEDEESCGQSGVHFHGITDGPSYNANAFDEIIQALKIRCSYFKSEECLYPFEYYSNLARCPSTEPVFNNTVEDSGLNQISSMPQPQPSVIGNITIPPITEEVFSPLPWNYDVEFEKINNMTISELCSDFSRIAVSDDYLTINQSILYVCDWCECQGISLKGLIQDFIAFADRKQAKKNALYFQGSRYSSVYFIINSVLDACGLYVGQVNQESAGYNYFWRKCVGKRVIALVNPQFDKNNFYPTFFNMLQGRDTYVETLSNLKNLQRTPVIILKDTAEEIDPRVQQCLVGSYTNLKPCAPPEKKLNPGWLNTLHDILVLIEECRLDSDALRSIIKSL